MIHHPDFVRSIAVDRQHQLIAAASRDRLVRSARTPQADADHSVTWWRRRRRATSRPHDRFAPAIA